jgi:hypothetical protein
VVCPWDGAATGFSTDRRAFFRTSFGDGERPAVGRRIVVLMIAAGLNLSLQEPAPTAAAAWFVTAGLTIYLAGTRVFAAGKRHWYLTLLRVALLAATVCLALVDQLLPAPGVGPVGRHARRVPAAAPGRSGDRLNRTREARSPRGPRLTRQGVLSRRSS